jgi:hypothetical protein
MRKAALAFFSIALLAGAGVTSIASARETVMLRAGEVTGPNAVLAFEAKPQTIIVRTTQVGVAGSRFEVSVDRINKPALSHIFTTEECKFGDRGSNCEVRIPASDPAFAEILSEFRRGRLARVSVQDAGVMKMDQTVSLGGFTKAIRGR